MSRTKRRIVNGILVVYLSAFSWGIACHAMSTLCGIHPAMYFFVWDMFCGWANYEKRNYIVAEGVSGKYYELAPAPWGEIEPFGRIGRRNYDVTGLYCVKSAMNILKHTDHEPIARIHVIEQNWSKKYNLPDKLWYTYFSDRKEPTLYNNVLRVVAGDGTTIETRPGWLQTQNSIVMASNPLMLGSLQRSQPYLMVDQEHNGSGVSSTGFLTPSSPGAPRGN